MRALIVILQMGLIIMALVVAVGVVFYAVAWVSLLVASSFPIIGKRHRHQRWDELNKPSGRASDDWISQLYYYPTLSVPERLAK